MNSRMVRGALALLIGLALAVAGLTPRLVAPPAVLALDETITTCDWDTFSATLAAVQSDGGGTIILDCPNATIVFANELTITADVTIIGDGTITFDGNAATRFFTVSATARLALNGLTFLNGRTEDPFGGGAISNEGTLEINASTFFGNSASTVGGAILNEGGALTINASTFIGNHAAGGGAIFNPEGTLTVNASTFSGNSAAFDGGAIDSETFFNDGVIDSTLTITSSTFSGNGAGFYGGAINSDFSALAIIASTFSDNSADFGGAIASTNSTLAITASTFSDNRSSFTAGAIDLISGTATVSASIVVDSESDNCAGAITSEGSNLSDDTSCNFSATGDIQNGGANLTDLADNGGPTMTMLPMAPSAAIDGADCAGSSTSDQRGVSRPQGDTCDIGSIEVAIQIVSFALGTPGPVNEGDIVPLEAVVDGPDSATLVAALDCDGDGGYETGATVAGSEIAGSCAFVDDGDATVGLQVCDADATDICATDATVVSVLNVAPTINDVEHDGPLDEGGMVAIAVSTFDPGLTDLLIFTFDCDNSGDYEMAGSGNQGQCSFADEGDYTVGVRVDDGDGGSDITTTTVSVLNVAPTIDSITSNAPVSQGQPVTITVGASDPGVNDILTFAFDCDDDGSYDVGPQEESSALCPLDPSVAFTTIGVQVSDDDGGVTTGNTTVSQTVTLCGNSYTGTLSMPVAGNCPGGTTLLTLPAPNPMAICIDPYTRALSWSPMGSCSPNQRPHIVPADGPLAYCRHTYTGDLRFSWNGQCGPYEQAGVIPG